jgi:uncharacterized membrane protein YecN with MAPEG domain
MILLPITLTTASLLGLLFIALSLAVSLERNRSKVGFGTGQETSAPLGDENKAPRLLVAVRRHGNFAEYVPISLVLLGLLELAQGDHLALQTMAGVLILARLMIAFGMGRAAPNLFRAGGSVLQWLMITAASVYGLVLVVTD